MNLCQHSWHVTRCLHGRNKMSGVSSKQITHWCELISIMLLSMLKQLFHSWLSSDKCQDSEKSKTYIAVSYIISGLRTCNISRPRPRLARRCTFHTTMGPQPHRDAFAKQLSRFNLATLTARADIQWSNSTHCYHDAKSRKTVHRAFSSFSEGLVVCRVLWRYW